MKINEYAEGIGFELSEDVYVRKIKDFVIYLKPWEYFMLEIASFYIPLNKTITKEVLKKIEVAALNNACSLTTTALENDTLIVTLPEKKKDVEVLRKNCNEILNRVLKMLVHEEYGPCNICPICKKEAEYHRFQDHYVPLHEECKHQYIEKIKGKLEENNKFSPKLIYGPIVSFIAGLIGLIPAILCVYFTGKCFDALVVLCPILTVLSYILMKVPYRKYIKYIIGLIPFVLIIAFDIYSFPLMAEKVSLSLGQYIGSGTGIRKIILTGILSLGGFGMQKIAKKFIINYEETLEKLK